ncbi:hypothetical protein CTEN210_06798 [Chaetoceros tenuissimus]|uniref:Uncharacterized protein n=1 Tax=Chaetoceros tenuissimus TaxID=426638 RepID=A0AAD3CQJ1_9STRA|nr:hypothetical protein CTEN210_06798 [Chaetoceros tenuissimus]
MSNKADEVTDRDQRNPQQNSIVYDLSSPDGAEKFLGDIYGPSSEGGSKKQQEKEVGKSSACVALAHSGGGIRMAVTSIGILRALHQKKIKDCDGNLVPAMHAIKYNSGISGGTIPSALYTYAQVPTSELLEVQRTCDPSELTNESLNHIPKDSMAKLFTKKQFRMTPKAIVRFFACILNPKTLFFSLTNIAKYHSYMSGLVYYALCKPLKIPRNKFFVSGRDSLEQIMNEQSNKGCCQKKFKEKDFLLPRSDVKTLPMILWTLNGERADLNKYMNNYKRLRDEAWDEYKAQETLQFFSGNYEGKERPNMTLRQFGLHIRVL